MSAGDVNADTSVNTVDIVAVQRFFLGLTTGIANTGKYQFTPANRAYPGLAADQTNQNYDALIFGDVVTPFADRPEGPLPSAPDENQIETNEVPAVVAELSLPNVAVEAFVTNFVLPVTTTTLDAAENLVGFQGDFTFDERVITFQSDPVQTADLTENNWNVSGNVLPGKGPIRILRISAYSTDLTPLSGSGTLFELKITQVSQTAQRTQLTWAAPPDNFIFIDADLNTRKLDDPAPGSVISVEKRK